MSSSVLLGSVAEVVGGGTPSTSIDKYWNGNIPWITPKDLSMAKYKYVNGGSRTLTEEGLKNSSAKILPKGTVIFSSRAPIGYVAITEKEATTNQGCKGIICQDGLLLNEYLYYWLKNNREKIEGLAGGSTFKEISTNGVRELSLVLPEYKDQEKAAAILSGLDEKIGLNQQTNKTIEALGLALFHKHFTQNPHKQHWDEGKLGDVTELRGGTTPSTKDAAYWDGGISWTSPRDLTGKDDLFLMQTEKKLSPLGLKKVGSGLLPKGTLLLSSRAPIGYLALAGIPVSINQGYIALLPGSKFSNLFMYFWLKSNMRKVHAAANGSTFMEISKSAFRNVKCVIPPQELIEEFHQLAEPLFEQAESNQIESMELEEIRELLLPQLLNNKLNKK